MKPMTMFGGGTFKEVIKFKWGHGVETSLDRIRVLIWDPLSSLLEYTHRDKVTGAYCVKVAVCNLRGPPAMVARHQPYWHLALGLSVPRIEKNGSYYLSHPVWVFCYRILSILIHCLCYCLLSNTSYFRKCTLLNSSTHETFPWTWNQKVLCMEYYL